MNPNHTPVPDATPIRDDAQTSTASGLVALGTVSLSYFVMVGMVLLYCVAVP